MKRTITITNRIPVSFCLASESPKPVKRMVKEGSKVKDILAQGCKCFSLEPSDVFISCNDVILDLEEYIVKPNDIFVLAKRPPPNVSITVSISIDDSEDIQPVTVFNTDTIQDLIQKLGKGKDAYQAFIDDVFIQQTTKFNDIEDLEDKILNLRSAIDIYYLLPNFPSAKEIKLSNRISVNDLLFIICKNEKIPDDVLNQWIVTIDNTEIDRSKIIKDTPLADRALLTLEQKNTESPVIQQSPPPD